MRILLALYFLLLIVSCKKAPADVEKDLTIAQESADTSVVDKVKFPMPEVPMLLTQPEERLSYALQHFWEAYDFADTTKQNREVGEQGMAEYIGLLRMAGETVTDKSIKKYLDACMSQPRAREYHITLVRHYLGNPDSPLRDDALYERFLVLMKSRFSAKDVAERERCIFELEMLRMNRVGTLAADFHFVCRDGSRGRLYDIDSPYTLVIFTDPTCEKCQQQLSQMTGKGQLQHPDLAVVALYPDEDTDTWQKHPKALPAHWIDAYSQDGEVMGTPLYHLPALPSLYLLDAEKHVLLRDVSLSNLLKYLDEHLSHE